MVRVGIVGVTGYAGEELLGLLLKHPYVKITNLSAKIDEPKVLSKIFPKFNKRCELMCFLPNLEKISKSCDLIFLALPHNVSMDFVPYLVKKKKRVIDLSADYRLKDVNIYEKFYHTLHKDSLNLKKAVYGLPEIYRSKIKKAQLIANPGCYPTVSILALLPLLKFNLIEQNSIIIDAKSGATGAGRKLTENLLFSEINEDFKAYKVNAHQHIPEINQELSKIANKNIEVVFVPHLLPLNRGILVTIYVKKKSFKQKEYLELYKEFYKDEPFVRVKDKGEFPTLKDVIYTNYCDIGIKEDKDLLIIIACIDNLLKGASGQAVQNMNIMFGWKETVGII
ncbi:MAG: N-acetyl-gamma-glutamyl-phosphate reductase [Candidatus Aenigmatarchaeota archaeon]